MCYHISHADFKNQPMEPDDKVWCTDIDELYVCNGKCKPTTLKVTTTKESMKPFKFYSDPGHGWLAVKRKLLSELGILDKVSPYSYQRGDTVYLEEDCDLGLFVDAWKLKHNGELPPIETRIYARTEAPLRRYDRFSK